jgi:hypothetical protein
MCRHISCKDKDQQAISGKKNQSSIDRKIEKQMAFVWGDNCSIWCHSYSLSGLEWCLIDFIIIYSLVYILLFPIFVHTTTDGRAYVHIYILQHPVILFLTLFTVHLTNSLYRVYAHTHIRDWNRLPPFRSFWLIIKFTSRVDLQTMLCRVSPLINWTKTCTWRSHE